jgi:hypothetical protein
MRAPHREDHREQAPCVGLPERELPGLPSERRFSYDKRPIQKDLLCFRLGNLVPSPILGRIALVPLKPLDIRPELGKRAHRRSIRLPYTWRNRDNVLLKGSRFSGLTLRFSGGPRSGPSAATGGYAPVFGLPLTH